MKPFYFLRLLGHAGKLLLLLLGIGALWLCAQPAVEGIDHFLSSVKSTIPLFGSPLLSRH